MTRRVIDLPVLVLNRQWQPVAVFDVATAITTVCRDMGWVLHPETHELLAFDAWAALDVPSAPVIPTASRGVPAPEVIVLRYYEALPSRRVPLNRRNLARRDGERCQYCGQEGELTVDHVVPRSKGGPTTWENCVAACGPCNRRKADRTPREAGLRLRTRPGRPTWTPRFTVPPEQVRPSWRPFVAASEQVAV